ncbi:ABC transporter ATP-binding protein/permease [Azohydromonas australica]|uniref:ABC transporter ATP-binding protein/permease n=1 Tax=Azohydromonas australica TaxID=364039 RepID=UPI00041C2E3D|nr:ABC transporter ATP-binding protein/permease [Azohydromonas australica]
MSTEPLQPGFNARLLQRFKAIAAPYWTSDERWHAAGMLAVLVALLLAQTGFAVVFNQETGEFTSALAARDADRFWAAIRRFLLALSFAVPVYALYYFVRDTLGLRWRRWMTFHFLGHYLEHRAYYKLNAMPGLDNPDQRIAEDINSLTSQSLYFSMIVLGSVIQLVAFTGVLWNISRLLVVVLIGYAIFATLFTASVFGKRLIPLNFVQLQREADFRFNLVRVRENAEPIAFYDGEPREMTALQRVFNFAYRNYQKVLRWQLRLNLFQYAHSFLTLALPSVVVAKDVLDGTLEVGAAVQAAGAFAAILSALTVVVEHFEGLSRFGAGIERLHGFQEVLQQQARPGNGNGQENGTDHVQLVHGAQLAVEHLSVLTPQREQVLISNINFQVRPHEGLLIVGPSGSGKSSLLRVMAGLWNTGHGRVVRPSSADMLFLPQRPYLPPGDLRTQLLYPHPEREISDEELLQWLQRVNLPTLADRVGGLSAERDWGKLLSVGEQQRLAFARALVAKPRYALLDESTSALDAANEELLYAQLAELSITPVSISHRPALQKYHRQVLELQGEGRWRMEGAEGYRWG